MYEFLQRLSETRFSAATDGDIGCTILVMGPVAALCNWASHNQEFLDEVHRRRQTAAQSP